MATIRGQRYAGSGMARVSVARAIVAIGSLVALILILGIVLTLLGANPANGIVKAVDDVARFLAGPFHGLFKLHGHKLQIAVNWGIAAIVWYAVARLIARVLVRV
jgi:hypothetical protein